MPGEAAAGVVGLIQGGRWGTRRIPLTTRSRLNTAARSTRRDSARRPVLTELLGGVAGQEVLSLACGQGQDARLLARLGATVTGIDVSAEMLRYAREHEASDPRGIVYVQGDAQDLEPFPDGRFDGVVCHLALMDIPHLAATLRSVRGCFESTAGSCSRSSTPAIPRTSRTWRTTSSTIATASCTLRLAPPTRVSPAARHVRRGARAGRPPRRARR